MQDNRPSSRAQACILSVSAGLIGLLCGRLSVTEDPAAPLDYKSSPAHVANLEFRLESELSTKRLLVEAAHDNLDMHRSQVDRLNARIIELEDMLASLTIATRIESCGVRYDDGAPATLAQVQDVLDRCYLTADAADRANVFAVVPVADLWEIALSEPRMRARLQEQRNQIELTQRQFVWPAQRDQLLQGYLDNLIAKGVPASLVATYQARLLAMFP